MKTSAVLLAVTGLLGLAEASRYPKHYDALGRHQRPKSYRGVGRHNAHRVRQEEEEEEVAEPEPEPLKCMTRAEADHVVDVYAQSITAFDQELLETYLAESFVDISDSINMFIHKPLGAPTFETKDVFIEKQRTGLHFPVDVLAVDAYDCASIALQWVSYFGQPNFPAKGIAILKTVWEDDMWKMSHIIVEYNALVWLLNMGGSYTWAGETYTGKEPDAATLPHQYSPVEEEVAEPEPEAEAEPEVEADPEAEPEPEVDPQPEEPVEEVEVEVEDK